MNKYYNEIEHIIKRNEINKRTRQIEDNYDTLRNYWAIGRLIVEAQGGEKRAKYGNELIKEWSNELTKKFGKGYNQTCLKYYRLFYSTFSKSPTVWDQLNWSQIKVILPIKNENKRNYYINLCIEHNLSVRELIKEIKANSYERLVSTPEKIDIIQPKEEFKITTDIKNPIVISLKENEVIENEHDLEMIFISHLQAVFRQLGTGYALIGNQYKISFKGRDYYIDLLLFNYKQNRFVVIELKTRELRVEDKSQVKQYMELVDKQVKEPFHNKTLGILITKEQDKYVATFVSEEDIIPITYEVEMEESK